ncbi:MAG: ABC transporter permease [Gemmatimonadetes bacterium]|nr:ABC transporter permease [Gemmatimonadota bacterium]
MTRRPFPSGDEDPRTRRAFRMPPEARGLEDEVDEELRFHLARKAERLMREGMSEQEARAEALRRFGDVDLVKERMTREGAMEMKRLAWWDRLRQDVRYALRQMVRNPGFTVVTVLTVALGIGATTSIFSVVDGILFRPLPFPNPGQLTVVWADMTRRGGPVDEWTNFADYYDLKERAHSFQAMGAWGGDPLTLTGHGDPQDITVGLVTRGTLSDVLRVTPSLGRGFSAEEDVPGAPGVVLLTDGFWRRALGGDPSVVGESLTLNDAPYTIIGVLPADFDPPFMTNADVWSPMRVSAADNFCGRGNACLHVIARLSDGVTLDAARVEATDIARQLEREHPQANANVGFTLRSFRDDMVADARTALLVLLGAVVFVLLIACVNVANLLLARASSRGTELGVRAALGAGRRRLTGQLLTESALLALVGGGLGMALARIGTAFLVRIAPAGTPRIEGVHVDGRVLGFAIGIIAVSGLLFGLGPSLRSARRDLTSALREGGRGSAGGVRGMRARNVLVSGQVALAMVLLVGSGLLVRSFQNLRARDLGFQPGGVVTLQLGMPQSRYPDANTRRAFLHDVEARLGAIPGVDAVGGTSWLPLTGFGSDATFNIQGRPLPPPGQNHAVWFRRVTPGYRAAMGIRLQAGRWLTVGDDETAPPVVVINEGMARRYFPDESPLGKRINLGGPDRPTWREIVGVVAEARYFGVRGDSRDALYLPYDQAPSPTVFLVLRSTRDPAALAGEIRGTVAEIDPSMAVAEIRSMESIVADALGPDRFVTLLIGLFAAVALALAVVGLYGVVSYGVGQRLSEMGVRMALGAEGADIRRLVLRQSSTLVLFGLALGVAGATAVTRMMKNLLFGVNATDPWTFGVVALLLAVVALVASAVPALRASRVDPIRVLRTE